MHTVLLDLDGTLVDSAALITEHLSRALSAVGMDLAPESLRPLVGAPLETALPATLGLAPAVVRTVLTTYRTSYERVAPTQTTLFPGITDLLGRISRHRLAVATSKRESVARAIVHSTGIADRLAYVGGADQAAGRIGKAAVVSAVLTRLDLDPATTPVVMVGDRYHDVEGAAQHGVPTIGVGWGYGLPGELAGARTVVPDADALVTALSDESHWSTS
jgi:phosphoglycolate phosphatase